MSNILDHIKLSGTTYDLIDSTAIHSLDGYWTSGQTEDAITAATAALAETVGQELSGKVDNDTYTAYTAATAAEISGKVANDVYTAYTASTATELNGKASTGDIVNFFDGAVYEMSGETHVINFYHGNTVKATINAEDFIADGFLSAVTIENRTISGESVPCLVFEWNTAAGIEETVIPLENIFNPDNFYDKTEIDNIVTGITEDIEEATSGKANTTAVTAINDVLTAHTADTTIHVTSSDKTTWSGKQDALVSGTNIKTINGNSLLGSGDISVQTLPTVQGTTLVFS